MKNILMVFGWNNTVINIVGPDGSYTATPKVVWNERPQMGGGSAALLGWRSRLSDLHARDAELDELETWLDKENQLSLKIVCGNGGVGKTRLAAEFATKVDERKGWKSGFIDLETFSEAQSLEWRGKWLLLIDYPEQSPDRLLKLLKLVGQRLGHAKKSDSLKVLLLSRSYEQAETLICDAKMQSYYDGTIGLTGFGLEDSYRVFCSSYIKLCSSGEQQNNILTDEFKVDFNSWMGLSEAHATPLFAVALALSLFYGFTPNAKAWLTGDELLQSLVDREVSRWRAVEKQANLPAGVITDLVAYATLFGGLNKEKLGELLLDYDERSPIVKDKLAESVSEIWPVYERDSIGYFVGMTPDLLGAQFMRYWIKSLIKKGRAGTGRAFGKILRSLDEEKYQSLIRRWGMLSYDQRSRLSNKASAEKGGANSDLESWLVVRWEAKGKLWPEPLVKLLLSDSNGGLRYLSLAISKAKLSVGKKLKNISEVRGHVIDVANHAMHLRNVGRMSDALEFASKANKIVNQLVQQFPEVLFIEKVHALDVFGSLLSDMGERERSLGFAIESEALISKISELNPGRFLMDHTLCLNNLSVRYREQGDFDKSLSAAQRSIEILRLVKVDEVQQARLSFNLTNYSNNLTDFGRIEEAWVAADEAVKIRRELALISRHQHEPILAFSLGVLAIADFRNGDFDSAIKNLHEAISIYSWFKCVNPVWGTYKLANNYRIIGHMYRQSGQDSLYLDNSSEAIKFFQLLLDQGVTLVIPDFFKALSERADFYESQGEWKQQLAVLLRAQNFFEVFALANQSMYQTQLVNFYIKLSNCYKDLGQRGSADAFEEKASHLMGHSLGELINIASSIQLDEGEIIISRN